MTVVLSHGADTRDTVVLARPLAAVTSIPLTHESHPK